MTRSHFPSAQNMPVTAKELVQLDHLGAHAEELVQLADMELVLQGMGSVQVYPWPCFAAGTETLWVMHPQSAVLLCRRPAALPQPHPRAAERGVAWPAAGGAGAAAAAGGRRQAAAGAGEQGVQRRGSKHWLGPRRCWAALPFRPCALQTACPATAPPSHRQGLVGKAPSEMARFLRCLYTPRSARAALLEEEWGLPAGGCGRA